MQKQQSRFQAAQSHYRASNRPASSSHIAHRQALRKTVLALSALAFCGNYLSLSLNYGLDFLFGSIFVVIAAQLFGPRWGALVALAGSLYTFWLWHHPFAILIFVAEAVFVGLLNRRLQRSVLLQDGLFWLVPGSLLVWLLYHYQLRLDSSQTYLIVVKYCVNGLLNALFASLFLAIASSNGWLLRLARACGKKPTLDRKAPLAHTLFNVLVASILVPTVLYTVVNGRQAQARLESEIDADLKSSSALLSDATRRWHQNHRDALQSIVRRYNDEGQSRTRAGWQTDLTFVQRSLPDFIGVCAANTSGISFACEPTRDAKGRSTIGISFADRADYKNIRRFRKETTSGIFIGRVPFEKPMIALVVPYFQGKRWKGYISGQIDVAYFERLLQASLPTQGIAAAIVDGNGRVVASTRKELNAGALYDRRIPNGAAMYRWSPSGSNMASVQRWNSSFRIQRVSLKKTAPWDLYIEAPYAEPQRQLEQIYSFNLTTALTLIAGAFVLASLLATALSFPLDELARVTTDLPSQLLYRKSHEGNVWPRSHVSEIDRLVRNFRSMEASLRLTIQDNLKARADLEAERARLDEANRLKDDFLAVLSHELRTPLVPVLGYADLIARGVLKGDDATEAARSVERNARAQLRLIEDLLDVSAIMSGKMRLQMGVVNLQLATREAGETMRIRAHDSDIGLFFDLDETTPYFWGDAARLRQVVWNLISNAIKFTPAGGSITVKLLHHADGASEAVATLIVADTGMGIEADFLPYVFDRFRQAGDHMTRPAGGLGLGLALAQYFVERHGGTIRADSPGEDLGATFTLVLPLRPVPKDKMDAAAFH